MKQLGLSFLFLALLPLLAASQEKIFNPEKYWLDGGVGFYIPTNVSHDGFSYGINAHMKQENTFYGMRFIYHAEFTMDFFSEAVWEEERFYETGFLVGKGLSYKWAQLRMSGGFGFIAGKKKGAYSHTVTHTSTGWFDLTPSKVDYYKSERFFTPAIPLELDVQLIPMPYAGLGCALFGNLNLKRPLVGFMVRFAVGKLR